MREFQLFIDSIKSGSNVEIENKFQIEFLEMQDKNSWRPLHYACRYGRVRLVKLLLANFCKINSVAKWNYQPIHLACKHYHINIAKILIENKCDINASDKRGYQPIHFVCKNGHIDIVKILIANKCDINASDKWRYQPIHFVCKNGHIDIVKLLIKNKCHINATNENEFQPIHFACKNGHIDIVKILIANKCDINASTDWDYQPIHFACKNGYIDIVKILIANKCDINASTDWDYQPIHFACKNGHIDIMKILIENKCDINVPDNIIEYQPIHLACINGHIDIVKVLIENQCDINASDKSGDKPIHLACLKGRFDIVSLLIAHKCDINASNKYGYQPITVACEKDHDDIVKILIANTDCNINNLSKITLIVKRMDLHCESECDHMFCKQSLEDETFKKGELIGSGIYTKVYKYKISNTNREIVIKRTKSNCEDKKNIEGNINKYSYKILHRNIVRYFGAMEISGKLCIFMEYIPGGSLRNLIDKSEWIEHSKVIKFSKQILDGLQYIHSQGIIHRDIKPDNMLLDHEEILKLTDFGVSKSLRVQSISEATNKAKTFCGTPNYMAPEIFLSEPYEFPADIWSTGASIIHMLTGKIPYYWLQPEAVMFKIGTTKKIEFTVCQPITETMQSFIDDLLTPEQSKRSTAQHLMEHSIFKDLK